MLSGLELIVALIAVFVGATIMGTVSFGLGLVVAPVLLLFLAPQSVVVITNVTIAILLLFVLSQTWRHLDLRLIRGMVLGGLLAVPMGVFALNSVDPTVLRITIAAVILVLGLLSLFDIQLPLVERPFAGLLFGFLASLSVTTLSIGGPLAAIYIIAQKWPREAMRASLAFYFVAAGVLAFPLYASVGLVDRETLVNIGLLAPGVIAGFAVALLLVRRMNEKVFRYAAIVVIITGSLMLLGREVARL